MRLYCPPPIKPCIGVHANEVTAGCIVQCGVCSGTDALAFGGLQLPRLFITSLRGHDMFPADIKTSDPYIKFYCDVAGMLIGPTAKTPRTATKRNTLNPRYLRSTVLLPLNMENGLRHGVMCVQLA